MNIIQPNDKTTRNLKKQKYDSYLRKRKSVSRYGLQVHSTEMLQLVVNSIKSAIVYVYI